MFLPQRRLTLGCIVKTNQALTMTDRVLRKINCNATKPARECGNDAATAAWFTNRCLFGSVLHLAKRISE
jgi:hypothetical protein